MTEHLNRKITKKVVPRKSSYINKKKDTRDIQFKNQNKKPSLSRNKESEISNEDFSNLDELAVENLVKLSKSVNVEKHHSSSTEILKKFLKCDHCDKIPNLDFLQIFINCLFTGDYSSLDEYKKIQEEKKSINSELKEEKNEDKIFKIENNIKIVEKSIVEEKNNNIEENLNESFLLNKDNIINLEVPVRKNNKRKSAVPETNVIEDNSSEVNSIYKRKIKKRKIRQIKNDKNVDHNEENQYILKFNLETKPINTRKYKSRKRLILDNSIEINNKSEEIIQNTIESEIKLTQINKKDRIKLKNERIKQKNEKPKNSYSCDFCSDLFTSRNGLNYHVKFVHSEEKLKVIKPYPCPLTDCSKKYKNKNGLYYHLVHHHADDVDDIEVLYAECLVKKG